MAAGFAAVVDSALVEAGASGVASGAPWLSLLVIVVSGSFFPMIRLPALPFGSGRRRFRVGVLVGLDLFHGTR